MIVIRHADHDSPVLRGVTFDRSPRTWELHGPRGMMVRIDIASGETTFGDGYDLDEAVKVFWRAVGSASPLSLPPVA